jgi:ubiquinone/menaquinone biosynthesis C-methylase UbiE
MHILKKPKRRERTLKMDDNKNHVCPVCLAGSLDNRFRRWLQNPAKILSPYVKNGMTVLDVGCGPGFFTVTLAELVGESGQVIAVDLQEGMLQKLGDKIRGTKLEKRIMLHKCEEDRLNVKERADFALAFYMIHEVPDKTRILKEIFDLLNPDGRFLMVEPKLFHVSKKEFEKSVNIAVAAGFEASEGPRMPFSWSVVLAKADGYMR